jgi:hypothetical protein
MLRNVPVSHARNEIGAIECGQNVQRTEDISVRHGLAPCSFGRRTFSLWRGGRRMGVSLVLAPLGGIAAVLFLPSQPRKSKASRQRIQSAGGQAKGNVRGRWIGGS